MSTTDRPPSAAPKKVPVPTNRAEPSAAKEQPKITSWSRHGAATRPASSLQTPVLRPLSVAEPADPPKAPDAQVSTPPQATVEAPPDDFAAPFIEAIAPAPSAKPEKSSDSDKPDHVSFSLQSIVQTLTRASVRLIAGFHERPIRRELKIGLIAAAICGAGLALERIVVERSPSHTPNAPVDKIEPAPALIKTQAAGNPEPAAPAPVSDSAQPPAGPDPAAKPVENAPEHKNARDLDIKTSQSENAGSGVQNAGEKDAEETLHPHHNPAPASDAIASPAVAEPLAQRTEPANARNLDAVEAGLKATLAQGNTTNDKRLIASASGELGVILYKRGKLSEAEKLHGKAIAIDTELNRSAELANDYTNLGRVYLAWKKLDLAEENYLKALDIQKNLNLNEGIAANYSNMGEVYFDHHDLRKAEDMFKKAVAIEEAEGLKRAAATDYDNLGIVYAKRRSYANACASWRKARHIFHEAGMKPEMARVQRSLSGRTCTRRGWWDSLFYKSRTSR
jgi:tetratricopeptide (TPR) repeat protein